MQDTVAEIHEKMRVSATGTKMEAALAKQIMCKNTSLLASQQEQQVNEATYKLIRESVKGDEECKISGYNDSLFLTIMVLANPGYVQSLASLHHSNTANPQQPQTSNAENKDASESISKEVITTASAFHKHIENTYNLSNTNNETTIIKHESRSVATTEEDNEIDTILEGHDYSIQISKKD